jgi:amino acid adenylation domain-containing protein
MKKDTFQDRLTGSFHRHYHRVAIEYGTRVKTYAQLDHMSNHIAKWIVQKGIEPGTFIGILLEDRLDFISLIIGILKAGCVFVPLDPANPDSRLELMIRISHLEYIFMDKMNHNRFKTDGTQRLARIEFIRADELISQEIENGGPEPPALHYDTEDPVYIYFTSGSTGVPKAVVGKNKSLLHFIDWEIQYFNISTDICISQFITPGFDAFLRDVFVPLCAGGILRIPEDKNIILNADELIKWVDSKKINLMHGVPSFFRLLITNVNEDNFEDLRYVLLSGEKIKPFDLQRWYKVFHDRIQLVNLYGPTETTMVKTCYLIKESDIHKENIPIGKPIKGSRIIILDKKYNVCEELVSGEIYIRTPFRTAGYYNDPGLTKQRFIPNPFNKDPHDLFYKTGDLGRLLADGNIELIGRIDRQVKIRGIRIELEEIESILMTHPHVEEAVVVKKEISAANELLIAYITTVKECELVEDSLLTDIKAYLAGKFPEYMVPTDIMRVALIPRKPNGKIDYEMFPDPFSDDGVDIVPPATNTEARLLIIWTKLLGIENIGVNMKIFDLGGNSLKVMSLISHIHKEFDVKLSLAEIFMNPTIQMQAQLIDEASKQQFISIEPAELKEYYELSPSQKRMYAAQKINPESISYNMMRNGWELDNEPDIERLEETFRKLIKRHESFRTSFMVVDDIPVQKIHHQVDFKLEYHDTGWSDRWMFSFPEVDNIARRFVRPFDLSRAPLLRAKVVIISKRKYILMVDMHHIISDGVSEQILFKDFKLLYRGEELPALRLQYKDHSVWRINEKNSRQIARQKEYWLKQLGGNIPVLNIITDYPRLPLYSFQGNRIHFEIGRKETTGLKNLASAEGATLYMVILSMYYILLSKLSGQDDIIVQAPIAGRRHADLENIVGVFVNSLALRSRPHNEKSFTGFLKEVKEMILEASENQDYPFEELVSAVAPNWDASRNPLCDAAFDFLEVAGDANRTTAAETPGTPRDQYEYKNNIALCDLILQGVKTNSRLSFTFNYYTRSFKQKTIEKFIDYFKEIAAIIADNKDVKLKDIEIIRNFASAKSNLLLYDQEEFGF